MAVSDADRTALNKLRDQGFSRVQAAAILETAKSVATGGTVTTAYVDDLVAAANRRSFVNALILQRRK